MKNDIRKVDTISFEMDMNDKTYRKMQEECNALEEEMLFVDDFAEDVKYGNLDEVYFYRRVLSVLANDDIPEKAIIGLFCLETALHELYLNREDYIGDSDSDTDLFKYVIEFGYRQFDALTENGRFIETYTNELQTYFKYIEEEENDDE